MAICELVFLMIMIMFMPIPKAHADPRTNIVHRSCEKLDVQNASKYFHNFSHAMNHMKEEMGRHKFALNEFWSYGKLYTLSQCMEDLSNKECKVCFTQIFNLLGSCFPATSAGVYLDGCFIRLENYSFYGESIGTLNFSQCSGDAESATIFRALVEEVIKKIVSRAPNEGGFAIQNESRAGSTAFGLGNCWRTLDDESCSECLNDAALSALDCLPALDGRVVNSGCYLRYSSYAFANERQSHESKSQDEIWLHVIYVISAVVVCTVAIALGFCVGKVTYKRMIFGSMQKGTEMDLSALHKSLQLLQFKYSTLEKATKSFSEANKLGRGGFGEIFKGTLADGREIAIKRLFINRKNQIKDICNEMDIMSKAQHKNLVRFLGCCFTKAESFVVYEFVANKSLDRILFDLEEKKELDWRKRLAIIIGTAEGLEYLHQSQVGIIHRDIKASNILLDLKHKPKIADFGLARFCSSDKSHTLSTSIAGTLGYMAPEYMAKGRLTEKVDVYSFGVLVLETVSGVQNNKFQSENCFETLVTHTWKHFEANTVSEIIDKSMEIEDIEEIKRVVWVGLLCTQESPALRPSMTNVVQMLKQKDTMLPAPSRPPFTDECMELLSPSAGLARQQQQLSSATEILSSPTKHTRV